MISSTKKKTSRNARKKKLLALKQITMENKPNKIHNTDFKVRLLDNIKFIQGKVIPYPNIYEKSTTLYM